MRVLLSLLLTCTLAFCREADGLIWMPPSDRADALFRFVDRGRAGFIDRSGNIVIPPTLNVSSNWSQAFYDGLLSLGVAEGPFLNAHGRKILKNGFYRIWDFSEGLAAALQTRESKWGFVDYLGQFVIPPQFPSYPEGLVNSFSDGLAAIEISGKLGYIDHSGAFVISRQFVTGTPFEALRESSPRVRASTSTTNISTRVCGCLRTPLQAPEERVIAGRLLRHSASGDSSTRPASRSWMRNSREHSDFTKAWRG